MQSTFGSIHKQQINEIIFKIDGLFFFSLFFFKFSLLTTLIKYDYYIKIEITHEMHFQPKSKIYSDLTYLFVFIFIVCIARFDFIFHAIFTSMFQILHNRFALHNNVKNLGLKMEPPIQKR